MHFKSELERSVYQAIKESRIKNYRVDKETSWSDIFPSAPSNRFVDFYFPQLDLIIEANGVQHYEPTSFSNDTSQELGKFHNQLCRDKKLSNLCQLNDVSLIVVPYNMKAIVDYLNDCIGEIYGL